MLDAYVDRKEAAADLDYDDLLLDWRALPAIPRGAAVRGSSSACWLTSTRTPTPCRRKSSNVLVPHGTGLTVVGDDAQSIYSFRAATVRNILDFPKLYPDATVLTLEQNYRSTVPILDAANGVIALCDTLRQKPLVGADCRVRPVLAACDDEREQTEYVILLHLDASRARTR